jgi:formate hydrogenlyase subunit 6/NADH:ubiquinone oxidoreductase subunit I
MILKPIAKVVEEALKPPSTLNFPEEKELFSDNYRGIHRLDMKTCISCSACARICPR